MVKYITDGNGNRHKVDFFCGIEDGKTYVSIDNGNARRLKVYYRPERTWNDHMGNTPCGYYCNIPLGNKTKRVYMF